MAEKALESLSDRAEQRKIHKERLKQSNIENVFAFATLSPPKNIPDEPIDPDWLNIFIENAETVSSGVMQQLWAKVFVNEIEQPGKFSIKSMEFLKKLTRYEADIFAKLCQYATPQPDNDGYIILSGIRREGFLSAFSSIYDDAIFPKKSNLDLTEWMVIKNLGLVHSEELLWRSLPKGTVVNLKNYD